MNLKTYMKDGVPEISCEETFKVSNENASVHFIDVRRPDEFNNELGHINKAQLVTLGPDLETFLNSTPKENTIIFICRSGARSANATLESRNRGFKNTFNMTGGMIQWNELKLPVERKL